MTKQSPEKKSRRREFYLAAGILIGVVILITPFIVHLMMGQTSPFIESWDAPRSFTDISITSPLDIVIEVFWLVLPAIFVILTLFWIVSRRRRWAGYDEAVKWTRH